MNLVLESAEALFRQIAARAEDAKWFPHGVTKIDLDIKAGPVELHVIVSGPDTEATPRTVGLASSDSNKRAPRLSFDEVKNLVAKNNKSAAFTNECMIAVCWKESSFDPAAQSGGSTATGLMQMTNPAIATVNNITPNGVHFQHDDMLDAAKAIQCGTYYLQWCYDQVGGDKAKALDKYGTGDGYSTNIIAAETCLRKTGSDPMTCLNAIHSFMIERMSLRLIDDLSGRSRFVSPPR
jgi:hypothetical protein